MFPQTEIAFGQRGQTLLLHYIEGKSPDDALFCPKDNITRCRRNFFDVDAYRRYIQKSVLSANRSLPEAEQIPHWTPYQLRHAAVTELAASAVLDAARAVAGQRSINITQHYNHADLKIAVEMAKRRQIVLPV